MTETVLIKLALMAVENEAALPVLGDHVLETAWFDPRVMQVLWPLGPGPRHGWTTKKKRDRAAVNREDHKAGYPHMFAGFAAKPTAGWARAIAAVLLFGSWSKRRWPLVARMRKDTQQAWVAGRIEIRSSRTAVVEEIDTWARVGR